MWLWVEAAAYQGAAAAAAAAAAACLFSVSLVGVAAEVHILKRTAELTGGSYGVALNEHHLQVGWQDYAATCTRAAAAFHHPP
jgi:hypothetical protein